MEHAPAQDESGGGTERCAPTFLGIIGYMKNGNQAATKQDLAELEQRLTKDITSLEQRLTKGISELENRLTERFQEAIHDAETRLLKAFYSYAEAAQKHFADLDQASVSFRERLGTLEGRILEIEKRLNMPPTN